MRCAAAGSLGQLQQAIPEVVAALVRALADSVSDVRRAAAGSLGQLGQTSPVAVAALTKALADPDADVRRAAAGSLGQLEQASSVAVAALTKALADPDADVQRAAAGSLGQLKISDETALLQVLAALNRLLHDRYNDLRLSALETARKLLDGRPIPGSRWTSLAVRRARIRRLRRIGFWAGIIAATLVVTLCFAWLFRDVDPNSLLGRFMFGITIVVGLGGGLAQILGRALRDPWDRG